MIIYKSTRIGQFGKPFTIYKFRTMCVGADKMGGPSTSADDPRLTKIGKWLKKYQLDEIPQIWNILKGDMNFIGPRPEVPEVVALMTEEEKEIIFSVKPGLSDLATLENMCEGDRLRGSADPHQKYLDVIWPVKKKLQIKYVKTRSWLLDLQILIKTIWRIIF